MSFLYPLFLAGMAAIGLPILLHMIRRHTRNRLTFSSLMFLHSTMPRFRSRSRIENLPLLILRCIIVCLLALAFARPFLPQPIEESQSRLGRRTVLLVDTSASMRRPGMWAEAIDQARSVLGNVDSSDRVCVMTFDRDTQTLVEFEQWETIEPAQRTSVVVQHLSESPPGWDRTNLGGALVAAAEAIEDDEVNAEQQPAGSRQIVLVSDLQEGSHIEALRRYEWPRGLTLTVKAIPAPGATNAALQLVTNRDPLAPPGEDDRPSIRVTNSTNATSEQFQLHWSNGASSDAPGHTLDVYVPPGNSSVVHTPDAVEVSRAHRLVLRGDTQDFDNTLYVAPYLKQQINILYLGDEDPNDPKAMLYYVRQAFGATGATRFRVTSQRGDATLTGADTETADIVIATDAVDADNVTTLRKCLDGGRMVLLVMQSAETAGTLAELLDAGNLPCREADVDRYAMLGRLEFSHPLLAPFSNPRFGNFTRVHVWRYRSIDLATRPDARVLAWFDSDKPAWFEVPVGKGTLLVFACGWQPADSDLALSSKFVPLLYSILEYAGVLTGRQWQYYVGDPVLLPTHLGSASTRVRVRKPDGSVMTLEAGQPTFAQTDMPGVYRIESPAGDMSFAVNIAPQESRTDPMPIEDLENLGVAQSAAAGPAFGNGVTASETKRTIDFAKMEDQQKLWRWVLVLVLAALLVETWLAGWLTRARPESDKQ